MFSICLPNKRLDLFFFMPIPLEFLSSVHLQRFFIFTSTLKPYKITSSFPPLLFFGPRSFCMLQYSYLHFHLVIPMYSVEFRLIPSPSRDLSKFNKSGYVLQCVMTKLFSQLFSLVSN